jgi:pimeloyl-ACP methyl ester carboxylesterase
MAFFGRHFHLRSIAAIAGGLLGFSAVAAANDDQLTRPQVLPTIFVHGFGGSASVYQSQAMRFSSNGVRSERLLGFEYNSSSQAGVAAAIPALDVFVDEARARFGVDRVNLVAHSLGTSVTGAYLADPARAAKVSKYIGIDGASNPTCGANTPGTLSCMGIFGGSVGDVGGNNVYFSNTQTHVQSVTSAESFAAQFEFLTGQPPLTTKIIPRFGLIKVAGRVVDFPVNVGAAGATLELWRIDARTGQRRYLVRRTTVAADGSWGPLPAFSHAHYELAVRRSDDLESHFYFQPWKRSTQLIRMNLSPPGSPLLLATNTSDDHAAVVVIRQKEIWVNHPSGQNDTLTMQVRGPNGNQDPVDVLLPVTDNSRVVIHAHDDKATPTVSSLGLLPFFPMLPFQTGVDVFLPAAPRPNSTIRISNAPRGNSSRQQVINVPNWQSSRHQITVVFNDYD